VHRVHRTCGCVKSDQAHRPAVSIEKSTIGPVMTHAASPCWSPETPPPPGLLRFGCAQVEIKVPLAPAQVFRLAGPWRRSRGLVPGQRAACRRWLGWPHSAGPTVPCRPGPLPHV